MSKGGRGVIYFSMGSILHTTDLDERFRRNVLMAFAQLPEYHFIVRIEKDDNVMGGGEIIVKQHSQMPMPIPNDHFIIGEFAENFMIID